MNETDAKKLIDSLLADLKSVHNECKKKYPALKESCEGGILKLRMISTKEGNVAKVLSESDELYRPLLLGCDSKCPKIVPTCLTSFQRLASSGALGEAYTQNIVNQLEQLCDHNVEELRILQTVIVILTTSLVVHRGPLAKTVTICFRLYLHSDSTISNTAAATIRQVISVIFDRMKEEDSFDRSLDKISGSYHNRCPKTLRPKAQDAYLLFQDLCQLTNGDAPYWLNSITEMTRTFGLELLESVLRHYSRAFLSHPEFCFLLKERVCPLIIKLFSPNIKYRQSGSNQPSVVEKPVFPVSVRLLRIVSVLIKQFYTLLVTECEIFLSLLIKFIDNDKPFWQRALSLEVLQTLCVQPQLLKSFCEYYDMQKHSTKVFHDLCVALSAFIVSIFDKETQQTSLAGTVTQGISQAGNSQSVERTSGQPGFLYNNVWIPFSGSQAVGTVKSLYVDNILLFIRAIIWRKFHQSLEQLDFKNDGASVSESYGMGVAFSCVMEISRSIDVLVHADTPKRRHANKNAENHEEKPISKDTTGLGSEAIIAASTAKEGKETSKDSNSETWKKMISASWDSMLPTLTILLEACTDEGSVESILKSLQTYASVCGLLGFSSSRDLFICCLCQSAIPTNYTSASLNDLLSKLCNQSQNDNIPQRRHRTPSTSSISSNGQSSTVSLSNKNIQCMRTLLSLAHCHGDILCNAWHVVLSTLQHMTIILGLKPSSGGSLKAIQANDIPSLSIPPSVVLDLPVLSSMLSRLFESSQYLDDVALHHLVDALCRLSSEDMDIALNNKEPCLFAVAKLLETGLVNLSRIRVLWKPLTAHLLEVAQHPHVRLREWGADALTTLVKAAVVHSHDVPLTDDQALQQLILHPLQEMSSVMYTDIRQQQFECVLQTLHDAAHLLGSAWPIVLRIIGSATNQQNEGIIRLGFQSLQLVVTDFLPILPCWCLSVLISIVGQFGLQPNEINISLTAVGLLWNLSDFLYQNRLSLSHDLTKTPDTDAQDSEADAMPLYTDKMMPRFDALWMCLYSKLGELCVDPRPAVRKSAGQTLFSTITAHGGLLVDSTWYIVLWKVLFPLLEKVKTMSSTAADIPPPSDTAYNTGNILIHHSRDTAEKQWAETRVLTLAGVARVFSSRAAVLRQLEDFSRAWALLLELIEAAALSKNSEVSLNSLKSFQEIVQDGTVVDNKTEEETKRMKSKRRSPIPKPVKFFDTSAEELDLWINAWRVWHNIGQVSMSSESLLRAVKDTTGKIKVRPIYPSQPFLTALVTVLPALFGRIYSRFGVGDLQRLCKILQCAVSIPIHTEASLFLVPSFQDAAISPLQEVVLHCISVLKDPIPQLDGKSVLYCSNQPMLPIMFKLLLSLSEYACCPPSFDGADKKPIRSPKVKQGEWIVMNYVPFAERALHLMMDLYKNSYNDEVVVRDCVILEIIKALHTPLKLKYGCPAQSTWRLAIDSLLTVLSLGLPIYIKLASEGKAYDDMWMELANTFDDFLFSSSPPPDTQTLDQHRADEQIDLKILTLLKEQVLIHAGSLPQLFVDCIMGLLNRGSIHSAASPSFDGDALNFPMREEFAKYCFETLLHFSFVQSNDNSQNGVSESGVLLSKLALNSLLFRCKDVIKKYIEDERLNGKFPLPRERMTEMAFATKAITTLLASLKKAAKSDIRMIDHGMWQEVIAIYPVLLDCITCHSEQVRLALRAALAEFQDLLVCPKSSQGETVETSEC